MGRRTFDTIGEVLYWSYANLAMADAAVRKGATAYGVGHFMIRAKLYKGLCTGSVSPRSLYSDEREKLLAQGKCSYCGSVDHPTLDHLIARSKGGSDQPENLVFACRSCNSSKGKHDVLEWASKQNTFLPLSLIRRYLKLAIRHAVENDLLDIRVDDLGGIPLPFSIKDIPLKYPKPDTLVWSF